MRRVARECVFQLVFEYTFYGVKNDETLSLMLLGANLTDDDKLYIKSTYDGIADNFDRVKGVVAEAVKEGYDSKNKTYSVDRIYRPDLAALILAVYELERAEVPDAVIINEAVSLAKKFGSEKSGKFVNGVLAKILKTMRG